MRIDNDGVGLHVAVDGPDHGPPVLLLHGISGSTATYDFLVPELPAHRLVRLDFRGHGQSDRAPGAYLLDGFASDAEAVLDQLVGGPAVVVGHSLGGITAAFVAQRRPDLVTALFLEDPPMYFGDKATYDSTAFASVFPLMQVAIEQWQAADASAEEIATRMAALPSMSGRGSMGDENTPDALAATGYALRLLDPTVFDPVGSGESLGGFDPDVSFAAPGVLLRPDRQLGAAFFEEHAARLTVVDPQIEVVSVPGVGHLIHDSSTHRGDYLTELHRFLGKWAPA
jgi:pimeloyl-ACP methyl ester carboxylesterase